VEIFVAALRLGLTSFGGPIAHLEYFRRDYVEKRRWVDPEEFSDLVTMSQVLPGPASSQLGMAIGIRRGGLAGGLAGWLGFTLPSALIMIAVGLVALRPGVLNLGWTHGLKLGAIAVVMSAVVALAKASATTRTRAAIALVALIAAVAIAHPLTHILVIVGGALVGRLLFTSQAPPKGDEPSQRRVSTSVAVGLFLALFGFLALFAAPFGNFIADVYRSGALVFGGGHVVLPLLEASVVRGGYLNADAFLAGYGIAQLLPGPLFTFASFLGAATFGVLGGVLATLAIFLPGALLVIGVLPYWSRLRANTGIRSAINGANAAVVGVLASVLFLPITRQAIESALDVVIVIIALIALLSRRMPVLAVMAIAASLGFATSL
jgi:chromate transporter